MKIRLMILAGSILLQTIVSIGFAGEMPSKPAPKGNRQTLEGMPPQAERIQITGNLKGVIQTSDGRSLTSGEVYFFNDRTGPAPSPDKYWRVPDAITPMNDNGAFSVELLPGRYYVGAIRRKGDKAMIGPPSDGDFFYAGKQKIDILPASQNDLGIVRGAIPFSKKILANAEGVTAIEGSIFDAAGKPVENAIVFAHLISAMNDRPLFVSERTDKHGVYRLRVAGAGTFYLRVRDVYGGGMPVAGAIMGVYGGNSPKAVMVKDGEVIKGINLTGEKFMRTPISR